MRVTKEKAAQNKQSMVFAAARSYREKGTEGIGIAELARSAGLTHGGFYGQFPGGKDQLIAEAVSKIFESNIECWKSAESLKSIIEFYLSEAHRDDSGNSCPIPSLGSDVARCGGSASASFTGGIHGLLSALMGHMHQGTPTEKNEKALQILVSTAGATLIARAVDDEGLSLHVLQTVAKILAATTSLTE
ncbi:TetR/AcrR family transcriptional regulator [Pseudomonas izuensis]|uniref:TetR/AcrR family transcriptional regulator n=1 Tax=Pseudomonas izuensis TaxID=2684212 RepID=UPI0013571A54|nr:TetR/AcrR family transcriptional regulator [Pseudomonas izuensis]